VLPSGHPQKEATSLHPLHAWTSEGDDLVVMDNTGNTSGLVLRTPTNLLFAAL
jgi:hypothetical protein